jgi:hypothetical protein
MNQLNDAVNGNRRQFLKHSGGILATGAAALASTAPRVHAGENNTIRLSLIGCGNRGNGAVANAFNTASQGPIELYAAADLHDSQIERSLKALSERYASQLNVANDRRFVGFDAYKHAIDVLRPGDVALCTTRAYIRPVHVEYAAIPLPAPHLSIVSATEIWVICLTFAPTGSPQDAGWATWETNRMISLSN